MKKGGLRVQGFKCKNQKLKCKMTKQNLKLNLRKRENKFAFLYVILIFKF
jgi:hypothetical protein